MCKRGMQTILDELKETVDRLATEFYEASENLLEINTITVGAMYHYSSGKLECRIGTGSKIKLVPVEHRR